MQAEDGQFASREGVAVSIQVGPVPVSDSVVDPNEVAFDKGFPDDGGIAVTVRLYGNSLVSIQKGDVTLTPDTQYTFSNVPAIEGGEGQVILCADFLSGLEEGMHSMSFLFSDGREESSKSAELALTVTDSTPEYKVVFMDNGTEYHRVTGVRDGDTVALPASPSAAGKTFKGWFTAPQGGGTKVTGTTPITEELGSVDGTITVYAYWTQTSGGGSGGGIVVTPEQPAVPELPPQEESEPPLKPLWQNPFSDVSPDDWFYSSVEYVCAKDLFLGVSEDSFSPNTGMTRAMVVTVLHRMAGLPQGDSEPFQDILEGSWYFDGVLWARGQGIVAGDGGNFSPDDDVTREQLVVMLHRYAGEPGVPEEDGEGLDGFADAQDVSPWAADAMGWAVSTGLIEGKPGSLLDPKGTATRAEVATIMKRFVEGG